MLVNRSLRVGAALAVLAIVSTGATGRAEPSKPVGAPPTEVVDTLHATLLDVMKHAETLGYQGRYDRLAAVLPRLFDLDFMAEKSVGRYWRTANEAERERLVETFRSFTTANYAGNFDGYSGQSFETIGSEESSHGTKLVRSRLVEPDGEVTQLNYRVRPVDGQWKIIDIYLNGTVSELALRRSEYSSLIQREGFDSLLVALNEKISDLAGANPAAQSP